MSGLARQVLTGTPRERGVRHGESYAAEIAHNVDTYLDVFEARGLDTDKVRERAAAFVPRIETENPQYAEEMAGVAAGSDCPIEDIALVNLRYEVMYDGYTDKGSEPAVTEELVDGCTSFGVQPAVSADDHTYVGQNWDWLPAIETFVMDVRRDDGPNFLAVTEAGMVGGKFGLNERGIGYVVNGLATPRDGEHPTRKPTHVRGREILEAERLDTAIEPVIATDRPGSRNYLVGHASGELIDLETAPEVVNYRYPEGGLLTHTNHFQDRNRVESRLERRSPHSLVREMRVQRLLGPERGTIDTETLKRTMRDDFCHPTGICRYVAESDDAQANFHTKVSVIMDLTERRMSLTDGPPRETSYETYEVA